MSASEGEDPFSFQAKAKTAKISTPTEKNGVAAFLQKRGSEVNKIITKYQSPAKKQAAANLGVEGRKTGFKAKTNLKVDADGLADEDEFFSSDEDGKPGRRRSSILSMRSAKGRKSVVSAAPKSVTPSPPARTSTTPVEDNGAGVGIDWDNEYDETETRAARKLDMETIPVAQGKRSHHTLPLENTDDYFSSGRAVGEPTPEKAPKPKKGGKATIVVAEKKSTTTITTTVAGKKSKKDLPPVIEEDSDISGSDEEITVKQPVTKAGKATVAKKQAPSSTKATVAKGKGKDVEAMGESLSDQDMLSSQATQPATKKTAAKPTTPAKTAGKRKAEPESSGEEAEEEEDVGYADAQYVDQPLDNGDYDDQYDEEEEVEEVKPSKKKTTTTKSQPAKKSKSDTVKETKKSVPAKKASAKVISDNESSEDDEEISIKKPTTSKTTTTKKSSGASAKTTTKKQTHPRSESEESDVQEVKPVAKKAATSKKSVSVSSGSHPTSSQAVTTKDLPVDNVGERTSSGRVRIKPLEFWKGERVNYDYDRRKSGTFQATVASVHKVEDAPVEIKRKKATAKRTVKKMEESDEEPSVGINAMMYSPVTKKMKEMPVMRSASNVESIPYKGDETTTWGTAFETKQFTSGFFTIEGGATLSLINSKHSRVLLVNQGAVEVSFGESKIIAKSGSMIHLSHGNATVRNESERKAILGMVELKV